MVWSLPPNVRPNEFRGRRASEADGEFKTNNPFSFLALAYPIYRRDRAAPLSHTLSPGMGSRVGIPRRVAGAVGPARLEEQTRIAVAKPGRFLGCALVTAPTMGGRYDSRFALWR